MCKRVSIKDDLEPSELDVEVGMLGPTCWVPMDPIVASFLKEREDKARRVAALPPGYCHECEGEGYLEGAQRSIECPECFGSGLGG